MRQLCAAHLGRELEFLFGTGGDVGFGRYGWFSGSSRRGTLFYTLGRLDQLREPRLHRHQGSWHPWRARHWSGPQTVDGLFWSNGVIDAPRLSVEVVSRHRGHLKSLNLKSLF